MPRRLLLAFIAISLALVAAIGVPADAFGAQVRVENHASGDELRYPVALLRGAVLGAVSADLRITNLSSALPTRASTTRLFRGGFKALVELVPGNNQIRLESGVDKMELVLIYRPMTTPYVVRIVYLTDREGNTLAYPTQKPNDPQDYAAKLATAGRLMQTFTAESMNDQGFGRLTFNLEEDAQGRVIVHTARAPKTAAYYQANDPVEIWEELYPWVNAKYSMSTGKNLVIAAFAQYDPVRRTTLAHAGLGGGGLAYFTNLSLFSWPSSLQQVEAAFTDPTRVDPNRVSNDTVGRGTFWALASTTIGASLHELGHTFGLPHSSDPFSVMSRGFDYFTRAFVMAETRPDDPEPAVLFRPDQVAYWDHPMALRLANHRWFRPDRPTWPARVTARGLPVGWESAPLGNASTLKDDQAVEVDANGTWTVSAGGLDLWNSHDGGLIAYTPHSGDGSITARLLSQVTPNNDGWTKTAVTLRESLDAGSKVVRLSYSSGNDLEPAVRSTANQVPVHPGEAGSGGVGLFGKATSTRPGAGRSLGAPIWLGIDRVGASFAFFWSEDGKVWNQVAHFDREFRSQLFLGIEASNHGSDLGNQISRLDNVRVSPDLLRDRAIMSIQYEALPRSVRVSWKPLAVPPPGASVGYNVYLINANARERTRLNPNPIPHSSYLVENLSPTQSYRFGVTAVVNGVESPLQVPLPVRGVLPLQ